MFIILGLYYPHPLLSSSFILFLIYYIFPLSKFFLYYLHPKTSSPVIIPSFIIFFLYPPRPSSSSSFIILILYYLHPYPLSSLSFIIIILYHPQIYSHQLENSPHAHHLHHQFQTRCGGWARTTPPPPDKILRLEQLQQRSPQRAEKSQWRNRTPEILCKMDADAA